ncbi:single-stranded-DNA-specific exonuclease RecJ [Flavobacterium agricola]|uniref:Single-stranded-DNA-specific exonuclease RecJ n=1 Tax=Flavobacterium agricola TaxID=2870839 RepID=A0ABY6M2Q9_9FLAO|nr:single-stranded-DNA-specific exonuclease RecJ [Flavobacterium agricola]UYW01208.1 single-stranded-DNA-specific exonuclease RecJ [Flavobacterium agricola]
MRWTLKPAADPQKTKTLMQQLGVDQLIATLLIQRGIDTFDKARDFFRPDLKNLHDPYLMKDMDLAVNRILKALQNNERIMVFGDYDVDGTTAVALVSSFLQNHSDQICTYIPDRYAEGYGVSYTGIDFASDNEISLIIALDCGIKSIEHVAYAKSKNIDFIIGDHHRPGEQIPDAVAVLDPKRKDCAYPYKELCGCGVGFKLIQALAPYFNLTISDLIPYLDLVATAIGADIVPITGENRILAHYGMQVINKNPRPGIKAILKGQKAYYTITDIVFTVAPRINAAGRMKQGIYAVELLTKFDALDAGIAANEIEQYNQERRTKDQEITKDALLQIKENKEQNNAATVVYHERWHKGVIGIVASRLTETYYRPTLVFTKSGDKLAASARSVKNFDVYNALLACSEHIIQFGGHMYAAGLTIEENKYEAFKNAFEEVVKNTMQEDWKEPELEIDAVINFNEITDKNLRLLKQFEPFGPENMHPLFITENIYAAAPAQPMGKTKEHLSVLLKQSDSQTVKAIGFNLADKITVINSGLPFNAVYSVEENEFRGKVSLQLRLRDIN